ncbi:hypothetical protein [Massilia sp. S19_KUP03_FR1]|uniref:hypothetical protein n=1 Tax=Massilia sp. S19_KUP03_FR1 TaxID=3025503 RepID=UPI002FCD2086
MPFHPPESRAVPDLPCASRRDENVAPLILTELNPLLVVDSMTDDSQPLDLITFGTLRELCPKCQRHGLNLVLRQSSVRIAHLFCADCASCYDAQYPDGAPALCI